MSISIDAEEELIDERIEMQLQEAKELLRHKAKYENEIIKINARLHELDQDADPIDMDCKEVGDTLKIVLGSKAHR